MLQQMTISRYADFIGRNKRRKKRFFALKQNEWPLTLLQLEMRFL